MIAVGNTGMCEANIGNVSVKRMYLGGTSFFQRPYDAEVEFLRSTPTAMIRTGLTDIDKIEIKFSVSSFSAYAAVFGNYANEDSNTWRLIMAGTETSPNMLIYMNTRAGSGSTSAPIGDKCLEHTLIASKDYVMADGKLVETINTTAGTANNTEIVLFASYNGQSSIPNLYTRIYYFKAWKNGVLLRSFIPVRVGTAGYMYDKVSKQLFGNSGSGSLVVGSDVTTKPYDTEIEYLESTGTQFIDSGIGMFTNQSKLILDVQFTNTSGRQIIGAANAFYIGVNEGRWETRYQTYVGTADTERHVYVEETTTKTSKKVTMDNTVLGTYTEYYQNAILNTIGIFGCSAESLVKASVRIYAAKVYKEYELVRDFVPVRVGSVGYLYDRVSGELFGNTGTGSFILGVDVTGKLYDAEIGYLESTGTQYINTHYISDGLLLKVKTKATKTTTSTAEGAIFGRRGGTGGFELYVTGNNKIGLYNSSGKSPAHTTSSLTNVDYEIVAETLASSLYIDVNGQHIVTNAAPASGGSPTSGQLSLFSHNARNYFIGRIYYCKVWHNGTLRFDLIPVRKDGIGYMYDRVSQQLFGNVGTGNFILGNDIQ